MHHTPNSISYILTMVIFSFCPHKSVTWLKPGGVKGSFFFCFVLFRSLERLRNRLDIWINCLDCHSGSRAAKFSPTLDIKNNNNNDDNSNNSVHLEKLETQLSAPPRAPLPLITADNVKMHSDDNSGGRYSYISIANRIRFQR